jgi:pimeloyl-ACP methyl ester carboxylesterase
MTVLLLPGLLCDRTIWNDQVRAIEPFAEVVVPDFRHVNSIGAMAQIALDAAPEAFALAGHSMGARVALEAFRMAPERVKRIALLDTGVHPRGPQEESKRGELVEIARTQGMDAMAERWLPAMLHRDHTALIPHLVEMIRRSTPETFANQQRALLDRPEAQAVLPLIKCPTLVLCGRDDVWSPVSQHEEIAAAIPHSKLVIVEHCGHMSPVEQPQAVTTAVLDWLSYHLQD